MKPKATLALALLIAAFLCVPVSGTAKTKFITLASGSPGGVYYPLGGGMAVVIQKTVDGVRCAAESTGASVENTRLISNHDSDLGMVMGSTGYLAINGKAPFKKSHNIMTMFQMYPAPMHVIVST